MSLISLVTATSHNIYETLNEIRTQLVTVTVRDSAYKLSRSLCKNHIQV